MDTYTTVLCNDAIGLIFQMKASMEFWDALKGEHFSISEYGDLNWDISGEGAPDEVLWYENVGHTYTCALIGMGESVGCMMDLRYEPDKDIRHLLTGNRTWDEQITTECFIAFLELHRPDIRNHFFHVMTGVQFPPMIDWLFLDDEYNETIWTYQDLPNDWRTRAMHTAISEADLIAVGPPDC